MSKLSIAIDLIQELEGFSDTAYQDTGGVWTIGWGRIGADVKKGTKTSKEKELDWLKKRVQDDLSKIEALLPDFPKEANECWAALVSLAYNIGLANFKKSTVYKTLKNETISELSLVQLETAWGLWCKDNGKVIRGLQNRRKREFSIFKQGLELYSKSKTESIKTSQVSIEPGSQEERKVPESNSSIKSESLLSEVHNIFRFKRRDDSKS